MNHTLTRDTRGGSAARQGNYDSESGLDGGRRAPEGVRWECDGTRVNPEGCGKTA